MSSHLSIHKKYTYTFSRFSYNIHFWGKLTQNHTSDCIHPSQEIVNSHQQLTHYYHNQHFAFMEQEHKTQAILVTEDNLPPKSIFWGKSDIAFTQCKNVPLAVRTADCLPILFFSTHIPLLGVIHAGWRGLAGSIISQALDALYLYEPKLRLDRLHFIVGPHIGFKYYEVGEDVFSRFCLEHSVPTRKDKRKLSLTSILKSLITQSGLLTDNVHWYCPDTYSSSLFFSHRYGELGRNVSVVSIE